MYLSLPFYSLRRALTLISSNQVLPSFPFLTSCALLSLSHLQQEGRREWDLFTVALVCRRLPVSWVKKVRAMIELDVWLMGTSAQLSRSNPIMNPMIFMKNLQNLVLFAWVLGHEQPWSMEYHKGMGCCLHTRSVTWKMNGIQESMGHLGYGLRGLQLYASCYSSSLSSNNFEFTEALLFITRLTVRNLLVDPLGTLKEVSRWQNWDKWEQ